MKNDQHIEKVIDYFKTLEVKTFALNEAEIVKAYQRQHDDPSLAIKILSVLGGFLASLAFLGFIALTGIFGSNQGIVILGLICIGSAIVVNKMYHKILLDTVSVTFYLAGFILLCLGLLSSHVDENMISMVMLLIALLSLSIVKNYLLSFVSVIIIHSAIFSLFLINEIFNLIYIYVSVFVVLMLYVFLHEAKIVSNYKALIIRYNAIRIGLVVSFISILFFLSQSSFFSIKIENVWFNSIVIILAILYLISRLINLFIINTIRMKLMIFILVFLISLPMLLAPSILGAILIILLCFYVNHKTGFILGLLALIGFIAQYYYDLNFTLLTKSIILMLSGLLFIVLYYFSFHYFAYKKLADQE